jgi:peptide deformylase
MANKLTPENIEAAVQHLENIQSGATPILDGVDRTVEYAEDDRIDLGNQTFEGHQHKKSLEVYPLIPPNDPRLLMQIAPFIDDTLEQLGFANRKSLCNVMYDNMVKYGGIGLSANQLGLPYRMFVMGGHPQIEDGKTRYVFNPLINDVSKESVMLKEGCLSFPFLFLGIKRPKWCSVRYTNENGEEVEETLHGMSARIFQHENEHMNGYVFTDLVSKLKLERAEKTKQKTIKEIQKRQNASRIIT